MTTPHHSDGITPTSTVSQDSIDIYSSQALRPRQAASTSSRSIAAPLTSTTPFTLSPAMELRYAAELQEILSKYHNYAVARSQGRFGVAKHVLSQLPLVEDALDRCTFCFEELQPGDKVIRLPCGHVFHAGEMEMDDAAQESAGVKRKRSEEGSCKGILFWLERHQTCPHCRFELPPEFPKPSKSECIIVPLLHRQYKELQKKTKIIETQKKQIEALTRKLNAAKKVGNGVHKYNTRSHDAEVVTYHVENKHGLLALNSAMTFGVPLTWQNSTSDQITRKRVLNSITDIALKDIHIRGDIESGARVDRMHGLAAKIELLLYSCSSSLMMYANEETLKERVLGTVKRLADKAKEYKEEDESALSHRIAHHL